MTEERSPKRSEIDWSNPPADLSYIALSDIRSAYLQGLADGAAKSEFEVLKQKSRAQDLSDELHDEAMQRTFSTPYST
jgi:hypothetical protein